MSGDEIDLAGLRAKADAAIPGPWGWHVTDDRKWAEVTSRDCDRPMVAQLWDDETAEFIAAANPAVVLALLDRVNREGTVAERAWCEYRLNVGTAAPPDVMDVLRRYFHAGYAAGAESAREVEP